ncbi:complement component 7b [Melanotaenia boesemani]|uniref:complement component 7b n=1 Tax=Melanotaenia boesemani TaxID=1250792 RepID=UPI001C051B67|nr:complement component 7b [Melanotaenia boesemani]
MKLTLAAALVLSLAFVSPIRCQLVVNCRWGPYGDWSECDGCTRTKVRTRHVEVFAQFGGLPCSGEATQTQSCVPQKTCPLETGCGGRFRCTSGRCISQSLVCNGDHDCEDGLDERSCNRDDSQYSCDLQKTPPNSDFTGRGYDVLTGKLKAGVINTLSFGGQCRKAYSGDHRMTYRLPQNILRYSFEVQVDNEESDESYDSSWSYMQHIQSNALVGHDRRTFHEEIQNNKAHRLIILKNKVKLAQFQNSAPQYLTLSENFWKALTSLPLTYDYSAYRQLLQTYGTHYLSEGSLGGEYQGLLELDRQALTSSSTTDIEYQRCWKKVKRILFYKKVKITCENIKKALESSYSKSTDKMPIKVHVFGGDPSFIAALSVLDLENPEANGQIYSEWASSVRDFPDIIDQKLEPLYELVKEVQCAGLKKLHLKRATEEYLAEEHPCHCQPCQNNGQPLLTGTECRCVCRPGTSGPACETGAVIGEQQGVIHGSWSCWSSWGSCSEGKRKRTRSCNNPAPRRGGNYCIGLQEEQKPCEEPELEYLKMMEPQCFSISVTPPKTCGLPPNLKNGYIQNPRDFYLVGHNVEYSCIGGYYLHGNSLATCNDNQRWSMGSMVCRSSTCGIPQVSSLVKAMPFKEEYGIGESVSLSCPAGFVLDSDVSEIMCTPSLQWSPFPDYIQCEPAPTVPSLLGGLRCKLWESMGKRGCTCKNANECGTSLPLCARIGQRPLLLDVCKIGALQCRGRSVAVANDSDCNWPEDTFKSCENCKPGTVCQGGKCICQNTSECPKDSTPLCVSSIDGGTTATMTECEVGARRCAGEHLNVISIEACSE